MRDAAFAPSMRGLIERSGLCSCRPRGRNKMARIMATEQTLLRGSCLCGLVTYEVPDRFEYSLYCHCSKCRRATGAAAKPFAAIKSDLLTFVSGGDHVMRYGGGTNHDAHCERCGSLLYSLVRNGLFARDPGDPDRSSLYSTNRPYFRGIESTLGRHLR